jgi:LmbE family N-acetylglucosaminyl deacetylase
VRPDTIITFGPDGFTGHTDHQVISRWVTRAVATHAHITVLHTAKTDGWIARFSDLHDRFPIFYPGHPNGVDADELALDLWLDDEALDRKTEALLAHRTQTDAITEVLGCRAWQEWIRRESFVLHRPGARSGAAGYHASMRGGL